MVWVFSYINYPWWWRNPIFLPLSPTCTEGMRSGIIPWRDGRSRGWVLGSGRCRVFVHFPCYRKCHTNQTWLRNHSSWRSCFSTSFSSELLSFLISPCQSDFQWVWLLVPGLGWCYIADLMYFVLLEVVFGFVDLLELFLGEIGVGVVGDGLDEGLHGYKLYIWIIKINKWFPIISYLFWFLSRRIIPSGIRDPSGWLSG